MTDSTEMRIMRTAHLVQRYAALKDLIKRHEAEADAIADELRQVPIEERIGYTLQPVRRLNVDNAAAVFPYASYPQFWKVTLDTEKLKASVPPEVYRGLMSESPTPTVKLAR